MQHRKHPAKQHGDPEDDESGIQHGGKRVERGNMDVSLARVHYCWLGDLESDDGD
jgi:hypothetical protein